ncbi:sensor histidine kinase [Gordonia sp. SL306]|uniref:sensor histidine kinase n=1 Tax=Gordonia sp. SL306 TaxID=2995145 RepID=UPI00226E6EB4|nr:HAMP domain-containing sensor histidine kinase [Gordonia sp. SL306]WAC56288.1 HAMP domain-containing sensor histidine kinase [Gordonia sp. SL306]
MNSEIVRILLLALAWTAPVVLAGALLLVAMRRASLLISMVLMVLIPMAATFVGVFGVSGMMFTGDIWRTAAVLAAVALVTIPAALWLGRFQARRTVWERHMREQERAAERSRRELIAWVSHDLRTPLADIKALAEALSDHVVTDPGEVASFATQIDRHTVRLARMVDDLFEMARINAGALTLDMEAIDLREVVDEVTGATSTLAQRAEVAVRVTCPDVAVTVNGSASALSRILTNLIVNAVAHTPPGGAIDVALGSSQRAAWIRVDDTGVGIPENDLERIFETSYRGSPSRTPSAIDGVPAGAGLGLAIAQGLVDAHSGSIVASNLDSGSRFEVTLPLIPAGA